jgi:flagellar hook-associated protein 3 FlgL
MRITDQMLFNSGTRSLRRNTEAVAKAQDRASAGRKVLRPSDDPISSAQILKYTKAIAQVNQHVRNMGESEEFLSVSDSALSGMQERIARASELAVEMVNASQEPSDRKIAAVEIKQIFEQLTGVANTTHKGQHVFAGNKIATKPFDFEKKWHGQHVGTSIEGPIEIVAYDPENAEDASNDQLNLTVDGVTVQVTLEAKEYSGVDLATEIMDKVNEALASSDTTPTSSVTVEFLPDEEGSEKGHLVMTSDRVKGRSSVVFNKVVQPPVSDPSAPEKPPLKDARQALGLVEGKSQLSGEEYLGDSGENMVLIEPGVTLPKNLPGNRVFKGDANGVDIFASLLNLQTALETSNIVGIKTAITDMEKATDQVSQQRALIGIRLNRLDETRTRLENFKLATIEFKSKEEGSDTASQAEAFSELVQQQTALQASLLVQARILQQPTLLSFLR